MVDLTRVTQIPSKFKAEDYVSDSYLRRMLLDFVQMKEFCKEPLVFDRGEGVWIWDVKGEKYLDGISGVWVANLGYGNKRVIEAMYEQAQRLCFSSPIYSTNSRAVELAEMIRQLTPEDLNVVKFLSGGSEAIETAIKAVRQYFFEIGRPHKSKIISRYLNFHGVTLGALTATGIASRKNKFEPLCGGFLHIPPPYCLRCPYEMKYPDCDIRCARVLEKVIQYEGPDSVGAFIAEPIQLSTGNIVPPDEYFPIIREICTKYEVLLIYDEIITGFGRTGNMWGAETVGAVPDILCMGKGMGCGYSPVSGFAAREKLGWAFWGDASEGREFADGHTYGGNPISSAVCIAALQELLENDLVARSRDMGRYLTVKLESLKELGVIGEIRGKGLMIGLELVKDPQTMEPFPAEMGFGHRVGRTCIHRYKALVRHAPNWLALAPPFIVQEAELDTLVERIAASIRDVMTEVG